MIKDVNIGLPPKKATTTAARLVRMRAVKEQLERFKRGVPEDDINVKDIPF